MDELNEKIKRVFADLGIRCAYNMPSFWANGGKDYVVIPTRYAKGYQKALEDAEREITEVLSAQPEQIARDIATIIENEQDMRVLLKNAEHTETHSCDCERTETHGWIPVTEALPEDIRPVIVTWKNNDPKSYYQYIVGKHFIGVAHFKGGKWYWYSSTTEDFLAEYGRYDGEEFDEAIEVVAWCELPEPYKEKQND